MPLDSEKGFAEGSQKGYSKMSCSGIFQAKRGSSFFVSHERVSGFPEKGADLRESPGTSGEVWGTSGEVWETSGEPLDCC